MTCLPTQKLKANPIDLPRIGLCVFITNPKGEFLLGKRKGSHGAGEWSPTGGHLEFGESIED